MHQSMEWLITNSQILCEPQVLVYSTPKSQHPYYRRMRMTTPTKYLLDESQMPKF